MKDTNYVTHAKISSVLAKFIQNNKKSELLKNMK